MTLKNMSTIIKCSEKDYATLAGIWERSVRATHDFLSEDAILEIKRALVPEYFPNVDLYAVETDRVMAGFLGLSGDKVEMLFIDADKRGHGYGGILIDHAVRLGATSVDVNEQNPSALRFYRSKGFTIVSRDEYDEAGRPYPILHMSL